jgi:hypothetical protein
LEFYFELIRKNIKIVGWFRHKHSKTSKRKKHKSNFLFWGILLRLQSARYSNQLATTAKSRKWQHVVLLQALGIDDEYNPAKDTLSKICPDTLMGVSDYWWCVGCSATDWSALALTVLFQSHKRRPVELKPWKFVDPLIHV